MKDPEYVHHPFEPTSDELPSGSQYKFSIDRRKFLQLTGGGLVVAFVLQELFSGDNKTLLNEHGTDPVSGVDSWIRIGEDGKVTVYTGKVEVGQNIRTSLSQQVAEELMVPLSSITMVMGDTDLVPFDNGTYGSLTTPQMGMQLRKAAATARQALIEMAAKKWNSSATSLKAENGMVVNTSTKEKIGYGELTKGQQMMM